ncbi:MAG: rod shape-determining protein MreD [Nitrospirae bacterium]|nr:rod shape-determining protein MreD [Nitrospirota bacterium]
MKSFLIYLVMALLSIVIQATLFSGIKPDIVIILICFYSIKFGQINGMIYGALTGVIIDSISGFAIGPNIISKTLAGFFSASIRQKFIGWGLFLNTAMIIFISIIDILVVYTGFKIFTPLDSKHLTGFTTTSFTEGHLIPLVLHVLYTAIMSMLLYFIMIKKPKDALTN